MFPPDLPTRSNFSGSGISRPAEMGNVLVVEKVRVSLAIGIHEKYRVFHILVPGLIWIEIVAPNGSGTSSNSHPPI
jgi:hypothetical protein